MKCKYYLMIGSDKVNISSSNCYDVSALIANLSDIKFSYTRIDYNGIIRKCGSTIEFVGEAKDLLVDYYNQGRLKSVGAFGVYGINEHWNYELIFECPLDFSTFTYDSYIAKIGCIDNSVASILKANNNTKYEFPVDSIKDSLQLKFDGIRLLNYCNIVFAGSSVENENYTVRENIDAAGRVYYIPPVSYADNEIFNEGYVSLHDQAEAWSGTVDYSGPWMTAGPNTNKTSYFLEALKDVDIEVDFSGCEVKSVNVETGDVGVFKELYVIPSQGDPKVVLSGAIKGKVSLLKGEKLQLVLSRYGSSFGYTFGLSTFYFYSLGDVRWSSIGNAIYLDVVKPLSVLNGILERIGLSSYVRGSIESGNTAWDNGVFLAAGESIRNFPNPMIHTSFSDFCKFMETSAGLVYVIEEDNEVESPEEGPELPEESVSAKDYDTGDLLLDADPVKVLDYLPAEEEFANELYPADGLNVLYVMYNRDIYWFYAYTSDRKYYMCWHGCEKYNTLIDGVYDKNILFDSSTCKFYITNNEKGDIDEYKVDRIDYYRYNHLARFGGININSSVNVEASPYSGAIQKERIYYFVKNEMFAYKGDDNKYYKFFKESESYQSNGRLNPRAVFVDTSNGNRSYFAVNTNKLIGYSGITPNLPERGEDESGGGEGSVPVVNKYVIKFIPRGKVFSNTLVKKLSVISEPSYSVSSDRIYSNIDVGYEKQDYDLGNNGKDEFNSVIYYSTGLNIKDRTLDFICPYRADSYGIQELSQKRDTAVSDTDSDNNTFIVYAKKSSGCYVLDRSINVTGVFTDSVFNAALSPFSMIENNEAFLSSFTDELIYASSEVMNTISIGGNYINENYKLSTPLFKEGNIRVKTNDNSLPDDWNGYVEFEWGGVIYKGYVKSIDISPSKEEGLEYELIEC